MDFNQSANNKRHLNVISLQNQDDDNVSNSSDEDGGSTKRSKGEQLDPLEVGSILEKVFSNLDVDSLKNARQVNSLWSTEGAKMLMTKCYLEIPWDLQKQSSNSKVMNEFKAFLSHKSKDRSMIPNITIDKVGDAKVWKSLGVLVESLKWNVTHEEEVKILHNILDLLPNLKYFDITNPGFLWSNSLFNIMKALTSVMSSTEKDQNPLVISNITTLHATNLEHLKNIEKFADCNNILIQKLKYGISPSLFHGVPNFRTRLSSLMNKLLSRNRNILKSLTVKDCTSFLSLLEFSRMPALTYLNLDFQYDDSLRPIKFSPTFQFSEKVPNLIHFKYSRPDSRPPPFVHHFCTFEQTGTALSVKILELDHDLQDVDIDPLLLTFPNVEDFKTNGDALPQKMFESIWKYGANLRKLTITIKKQWGYPMDDLDAFITGFTRETVNKIKETPNLASRPLEEMEQLRVNPSILNLKHLEHLTIDLLDLDQNNVPERFLATAGEYALKRMPNESKILITFVDGNLGLGDLSSPLILEVSKLSNVTIKFEGWRHYAVRVQQRKCDVNSQ